MNKSSLHRALESVSILARYVKSPVKLTSRVVVRFQHGYDHYMANAFPHDELKPLSNTFTDSLGKSQHENSCRKTETADWIGERSSCHVYPALQVSLET